MFGRENQNLQPTRIRMNDIFTDEDSVQLRGEPAMSSAPLHLLPFVLLSGKCHRFRRCNWGSCAERRGHYALVMEGMIFKIR